MFFYNEGDSEVSQQLPLITEGMVLELDAEDYETVGYNGGTKTSGGNDPIYVGTGEKYFQFNGAGHISWPSNSAYAFGTEAFTLEFWTQGYLNSFLQPDNTIDGSGNNIWWTGISPSLGMMVSRHAVPTHTALAGGNQNDFNQWSHTVVVRNPGNNAVYVNGQQQALTKNDLDGVSFGQSGMIIGAGSANTFATGKIAAVRIFNRSLTEAEALQNFNATKSRFGL